MIGLENEEGKAIQLEATIPPRTRQGTVTGMLQGPVNTLRLLLPPIRNSNKLHPRTLQHRLRVPVLRLRSNPLRRSMRLTQDILRGLVLRRVITSPLIHLQGLTVRVRTRPPEDTMEPRTACRRLMFLPATRLLCIPTMPRCTHTRAIRLPLLMRTVTPPQIPTWAPHLGTHLLTNQGTLVMSMGLTWATMALRLPRLRRRHQEETGMVTTGNRRLKEALRKLGMEPEMLSKATRRLLCLAQLLRG